MKRTVKLIFDAMLKLMSCRKFTQITVNELCGNAQISRATFYAHFKDKYDLLNYWLKDLIEEIYGIIKHTHPDKKKECANKFIYSNRKIIENLLGQADEETYSIVFGVFLEFSNVRADGKHRFDTERVVMSSIYVGGLIAYLKWQVDNKFPKEVEVFNEFLYDMIKYFFDF